MHNGLYGFNQSATLNAVGNYLLYENAREIKKQECLAKQTVKIRFGVSVAKAASDGNLRQAQTTTCGVMS